MRLKAALLTAAAAGGLLLVAACGGGDAGGGGGSSSTPDPSQSQLQSQPSTPANTSGSGSGSAAAGNSAPGNNGGCQVSTQTSIAGGPLFVADQGLIGATLLSDNGFEVELGYSTCNSNCTNPQRQDAFAFAFGVAPPLFTAQTMVGTTLELQPQGGIPINGQMVSSFPSGTPIFLVFSNGDDFSTTDSDNKDLGRAIPETAVVTYGVGNTATVEFHTAAGSDVRVGLTNVRGSLDAACSM